LVLTAIEQKDEVLINMIEAKADELAEEELLAAYDFAIPYLQQLIGFQKKVASSLVSEKIQLEELKINPALVSKVIEFLKGKLEPAIFQADKQKTSIDLEQIKAELLEMVKQEFGDDKTMDAKNIFELEQEKVLDDNILFKEKRPDGRALDQIRDLTVEVDILPRTHGTGLFTRGQTRVLSILTLGSPGDQQLLEGMDFSGKKRFMHHYNFPPYSSGEVKRLGSPGRREIGHGMLAEKALLAVIPSFDDFPYTIRIVSEVLTSNGSTSMASATAASLALMDAGVPIKRPVTGIAVGLIKKDNKTYKLLTYIQGPEDHSGDMDFKVAGTEEGITAIQMDVKTDGITRKIMEEALLRGKKARLEIFKKIKQILPEPRKQLSPLAPRIVVLRINPEKIGAVIGTGGKVINSIIESCNVTIDIEDDGRVFVAGQDDASMQRAVEWVKSLTHEYEVGAIMQGKVKRITEFGAFVEIAPGQDGLVHISQLANFRVNKVEDVLKIGQEIPVKIISIDDSGKIALSAKEAGFNPSAPQNSLSQRNNYPSSEPKPRRGFFKKNPK
jgi:polyribonucleotide nucleotidyltransferase